MSSQNRTAGVIVCEGRMRGASDYLDYVGLEDFSSSECTVALHRKPVCPCLPSEIKSNLTLGWAHTLGADPACYECWPLPHETLCVELFC